MSQKQEVDVKDTSVTVFTIRIFTTLLEKNLQGE